MSDKKKKTVRTPVQDRSIDKKKSIRRAGEELFAKEGYRGANSKAIALKAGVSIGSFYAYYPDKGILFLEIIESYYQEIFQHVKAFQQSISITVENPGETIKKVIQALYQAHSIKPELHREINIMLFQAGNPSPKDKVEKELFSSIMHKVKELDKAVQVWLQNLLYQWLPHLEKEKIATISSVLFRASEEIIHRLKFFPDSIGPADEILEQLSIMLTAYLSTLRE